jgi:hypothetical protein
MEGQRISTRITEKRQKEMKLQKELALMEEIYGDMDDPITSCVIVTEKGVSNVMTLEESNQSFVSGVPGVMRYIYPDDPPGMEWVTEFDCQPLVEVFDDEEEDEDDHEMFPSPLVNPSGFEPMASPPPPSVSPPLSTSPPPAASPPSPAKGAKRPGVALDAAPRPKKSAFDEADLERQEFARRRVQEHQERRAREQRELQRLLCPLKIKVCLQQIVVPQAAPQDAPLVPPPADPAANPEDVEMEDAEVAAPAEAPVQLEAPAPDVQADAAPLTREQRELQRLLCPLEIKVRLQQIVEPEAAPQDAPLVPPPADPAADPEDAEVAAPVVLPSSAPGASLPTRRTSSRIAGKAVVDQERRAREQMKRQENIEYVARRQRERRQKREEKAREQQLIVPPVLQDEVAPEAAPEDAPWAPPPAAAEPEEELPPWKRFQLLPPTSIGVRHSPRNLEKTNGAIAFCKRGWPHVW